MKKVIDCFVNENNEPCLMFFNKDTKTQSSLVCESLEDKAKWIKTKWQRMGFTQITFAAELGMVEKSLYKKLRDFSFTLKEVKEIIRIFELNKNTAYYLFLS